MIKRGSLNVPVIGVAKAGWNLAELKESARDSLEKHGGIDPEAFEKLSDLLRYVDGKCLPTTCMEIVVRLRRPPTIFQDLPITSNQLRFRLSRGIEFDHFTFHDLKRKGVTDTTGNKQEASGHRNANLAVELMKVYERA